MNQAKIYDIAGAAGVSLATVSRVLNHPEKVKESTRKRVLKIIKEMGYKPNANARGLASRRSTTVAIVIPQISRASVAEMIAGIDDSAKKFGYTIRLFTNNDPNLASEVWSEVIASSVDGILLMNDEITKETIEHIRNTPVPVVFVNQISPTEEFGSVGIDYEKCAYDITKEMISRGNKDIMFISTEHKYTVNELKEKGYRRAMEEAGLDANIVRSSGDLSINEPQFTEIIEEGIPEVVLVVRDSMAISFMNIAMNKGYKVPDDLQVIGFQNTRYAVLSNPKLTCVETPIYEIGNKAMAHLTELMKNEDEKQPANLQVDYQVIWRGSTK
ncbi:MAG TPA: LacI family transcriptional regulator [Acholeplasmataceae bacterium]|jgi:LacI family transcriptional regulator|nr:LacI family transcriptional regulator [Acholeplasmataceae bacterium]